MVLGPKMATLLQYVRSFLKISGKVFCYKPLSSQLQCSNFDCCCWASLLEVVDIARHGKAWRHTTSGNDSWIFLTWHCNMMLAQVPAWYAQCTPRGVTPPSVSQTEIKSCFYLVLPLDKTKNCESHSLSTYVISVMIWCDKGKPGGLFSWRCMFATFSGFTNFEGPCAIWNSLAGMVVAQWAASGAEQLLTIPTSLSHEAL